VHPNPDPLQPRLEDSFFESFPSTPAKSVFADLDTEELMPRLNTLDFSGNRHTQAVYRINARGAQR
jgi:hypothetical protein